MKAPIKILHIHEDYRVIYTLIYDNVEIKSTLPLETALSLLKNETFDFLIFKPQNLLILTPQTSKKEMDRNLFPFSNSSSNGINSSIISELIIKTNLNPLFQ